MFKATKYISLDGSAIVTKHADHHGELEHKDCGSPEEAQQELNELFVMLNADPDVRVESEPHGVVILEQVDE